MKKLKSFFKLAFTTKEITDLNLLCFTDDHVKKLIKMNKDGKYDELIRATRAVYYGFLENYNLKEETSDHKKEHTETVAQLIEELKESLRKLEAFLRYLTGKKTSEYNLIFPEGLSEISRINYSNIDDKLSRILFQLKASNTNVSLEIIESIENTYNTYQIARKSQLKKKELYSKKVKSKSELRKDLCKQLQVNLYSIAKDHINDSDMVEEFFTENLLYIRNQNRLRAMHTSVA